MITGGDDHICARVDERFSDGATDTLAGALVDLRSVRLDSSVTRNDFEQTDLAGGSLDSERTSWYELLTAYFPLHLRSDVAYRRVDSTSTIDSPFALTTPMPTLPWAVTSEARTG